MTPKEKVTTIGTNVSEEIKNRINAALTSVGGFTVESISQFVMIAVLRELELRENKTALLVTSGKETSAAVGE